MFYLKMRRLNSLSFAFLFREIFMFQNFNRRLLGCALAVPLTLSACVSLSGLTGENKEPIPENAPKGLQKFQKPLYEWKVWFPNNVHLCIYQDAYQGKSQYGKTETAVYNVSVYTAWNKSCDRSMKEIMETAPQCQHNLDSVTGWITNKYGGGGWRLISSGYFDRRTSDYTKIKGESSDRQRDFWSGIENVQYKTGCNSELTDF